VLTPAEKGHLEGLAKAAAPEDGVSKRAKIVLLCAEGLENREVARRVGISAHTVGRSRAQFLMEGVRGLQDGPSRGGRRPIAKVHWRDGATFVLRLVGKRMCKAIILMARCWYSWLEVGDRELGASFPVSTCAE
jgi:hypothetical protein